MSISIYIPYFYIIQHLNSGRYYAGVKYGIGSNPNQLLKANGYQTSSNIIKQIILEEGIEAFIIRKIKLFETGEAALAYESRFLRRVNAAFNDSFLNRSNNSFGTLNVDYEKTKQTCLKKYGYEYVLQSVEIREKGKKTLLENYGVENPSQSPELQEKMKQTFLERYGTENPFQSEEVKERIKQTMLEKYGVESPYQLEEIREKGKKTCLENLGVENPSQSDEVKEKKKQTCLENNGTENPFQSEEVKERIKQTMLEKYGVKNPSQSPEIQEKKRCNFNSLNNRPIIIIIRKYRDKFSLKLGSKWFWKEKEFLDNMLLELKMIYGEL